MYVLTLIHLRLPSPTEFLGSHVVGLWGKARQGKWKMIKGTFLICVNAALQAKEKAKQKKSNEAVQALPSPAKAAPEA